MSNPDFTVIVPARNAAATIAATIASVLAQTVRDFELLLIDDGSTDRTLHIMLEAAALDERLHVISLDGVGAARARNIGVEHAHGALIAFFDADDLWVPEKLERHAALHAGPVAPDASYAAVTFLDPRRTYAHGSSRSTVGAGPLTPAQAVAENPVCTMSNLVVSREAWKRTGALRNGMQHAEDQEWLARATLAGCHIVGIDEVLVRYRTTSGGLSSDLRRMHAGWRRFARTYQDRVDIRAAEAVYCRYLARRALRLGEPARVARRYALLGLRYSPSAFLADRWRGGMTLAGAFAGPFLPLVLRNRLFA